MVGRRRKHQPAAKILLRNAFDPWQAVQRQSPSRDAKDKSKDGVEQFWRDKAVELDALAANVKPKFAVDAMIATVGQALQSDRSR